MKKVAKLLGGGPDSDEQMMKVFELEAILATVSKGFPKQAPAPLSRDHCFNTLLVMTDEVKERSHVKSISKGFETADISRKY